MSLLQELRLLKAQLAAVAQVVLDDWTGDGEDPTLGAGGPCDQIARAMCVAVGERLPGVELDDGGQDGDDHAWVVVSRGDDKCGVDIPASAYEVGSGYSWRKREGVNLTWRDVAVWTL